MRGGVREGGERGREGWASGGVRNVENGGDRGVDNVQGTQHNRARSGRNVLGIVGGAGNSTRSREDENDFVRVSTGIVGTCEDVEKPYVRQTRQPDPRTVRPEWVLKKSLESVVRREASGEAYETQMDSLMSICQDLKLQQIDNGFTVEVRELMATYALRDRCKSKKGRDDIDVATFGDSILHLHSLYQINPNQPRELEFSVYRFIFWLSLALKNCGDSSLNKSVSVLSLRKDHECVRHALRVYQAVCTGDACCYFALLRAIPVEAPEQLHIHETAIVPHMRDLAFNQVLKAFKMQLPLSMLGRCLGFASDTDTESFLVARGGILVDGTSLDVDKSKASAKVEST